MKDATDSVERTLVVKTQDEGDETPGEACLVAVSGPDLGRRFRLRESACTIGRSPDAGIQVEEQGVSRLHALIEQTGNQYAIRDLDSTNGTLVNGHAVRQATLRDGDTLRIGRAVFKFLMGNNIENAYHEEIYRLTTVDDLTRVSNRRHFLANLERELARSLRYGRALGLILLDIDRFKRINDTWGHLAGDTILHQLAQRVLAICRDEDIFARYGGEEFILLAPESDLQSTGALARRIRLAVASQPFLVDEEKHAVTVSLGVTDIAELQRDQGIEMDASQAASLVPHLIRIADEKLYTAKNLGRNRVVL